MIQCVYVFNCPASASVYIHSYAAPLLCMCACVHVCFWYACAWKLNCSQCCICTHHFINLFSHRKKIRNLKKKVRQSDELQQKVNSGELQPNDEQNEKLASRGKLEGEIAALEKELAAM